MSDETAHYMESTSRLRTENEELRVEVQRLRDLHEESFSMGHTAGFGEADSLQERVRAAEATMREVAEELRALADKFPPRPDGLTDNTPLFALQGLAALADRLDPPPVVENLPA